VALYQDGLCQWLGLSGFSVDRADLAVSGQLVFSLSSGVLVIPISESVDTAAALLRLKKDQEKEQKEIREALADSSLFAKDPAKATAMFARDAQIDEALLKALERWEQLSAA
jgi:hypothetical protein